MEPLQVAQFMAALLIVVGVAMALLPLRCRHTCAPCAEEKANEIEQRRRRNLAGDHQAGWHKAPVNGCPICVQMGDDGVHE